MKILGDDGQQLATVIAAGSSSSGVDIELKRFVDGRGELLRYYFIRGGRNVRLVNDDVALAGTLHTQWAGNSRSWSVTLTPRPEAASFQQAPARSAIQAR